MKRRDFLIAAAAAPFASAALGAGVTARPGYLSEFQVTLPAGTYKIVSMEIVKGRKTVFPADAKAVFQVIEPKTHTVKLGPSGGAITRIWR